MTNSPLDYIIFVYSSCLENFVFLSHNLEMMSRLSYGALPIAAWAEVLPWHWIHTGAHGVWRFFSVKVSSQWWNVLIRLRWGYYYWTISIPDHYPHLFFNISLSFVDKRCDSASSESVLIWSHLAYWKIKIIEQK